MIMSNTMFSIKAEERAKSISMVLTRSRKSFFKTVYKIRIRIIVLRMFFISSTMLRREMIFLIPSSGLSLLNLGVKFLAVNKNRVWIPTAMTGSAIAVRSSGSPALSTFIKKR